MVKSADAFKTISEAADSLDLPQHVLRFWETRFPQVKPLKRGGGRRYYRPEDVMLLKGIRHLLYDQGFTIKGVQRILKEDGPRHAIAIGEAGSLEAVTANEQAQEPIPTTQNQINVEPLPAMIPVITDAKRDKLVDVMRELLDCKRLLDKAREG